MVSAHDNEDDVTFEPSEESENLKDPAEAVKKLKGEIKAVRKEREEYLRGWQRAQADYANLKKDEEKGRKDFAKYAEENLIRELIPAMQSFHMAFGNKEAWEKVDLNWRMGVQYIYSQLENVLEQHGVSLIDPKQDEAFDPVRHESIASVPTSDEKQNHTVAEVIQKGYALHGKIVEPARVKLFEKS